MDIFERIGEVANDLADDWNADFLYINSDIDEEAFECVFHETEPRRSKGEYLFMQINAEAGSAASALKIMRYFQYKYSGTLIVVLGQCTDVGKIMCGEATETWVGKASGLAPLDLRNIAESVACDVDGPIGGGSMETFQRLHNQSDFSALHEAINIGLRFCDLQGRRGKYFQQGDRR